MKASTLFQANPSDPTTCAVHAGGPAFNLAGQVVGIAFQSLAGSDAENIGYLIPTNVIQHFLSDYRSAVAPSMEARGLNPNPELSNPKVAKPYNSHFYFQRAACS